MTIPLLEFKPSTQNQRVNGYEVPNEDTPSVYRLVDAISDTDINNIIWAIYRQIFAEQLILQKHRQLPLESQLRNGNISVKEFVRGLGKSDVYRQMIWDTNSNYRVVDLTFKRFLGRSTYGKDEQIAWSIVIATKGLHGFIDAVVDSAEYTANFGDDIVPYQRRRFDGRPINLVNPRYDSHWRNRQIEIQGISYYTVGKGDGRANKLPVGQAIPANFMAMAKGMITPQFNYQRTIATVTSQVRNMELIDNSRDGETPKPPVTRTDAALPYRYIPSLPKY